MANVPTITLPDGEATPVNHLFDFSKSNGDYSLYENQSSETWIGREKLSFDVRRPKGPNGGQSSYVHLVAKMEMPVLHELTTGSTESGYTAEPRVAYRNTVEVTIRFGSGSVTQERLNLRKMLEALTTKAAWEDWIDNFDRPQN